MQASLGSGPGGLLSGDGKAFEYAGHGYGQGKEHDPADRPEAGAASGTLPGNPSGTNAGGRRNGPVLRWRLGVKAAVLAGIVAVMCAAWFWWQVSAGRAVVMPLSDVTPSASAASAGSAEMQPDTDAETPGLADAGAGESGPGSAEPSVLHVAGAVARPGIVELAPGSRVHDAVAAAGGSTPAADLDRLNLAAVVVDGQKIYVPRQGEPVPAADSAGAAPGETGIGSGGGVASAAAGKTNLNSAGLEELGALPKVGPVLAQRIVDWRKEHGPFTSVEELDAVDGVGPKMLETLLPLVSVG